MAYRLLALFIVLALFSCKSEPETPAKEEPAADEDLYFEVIPNEMVKLLYEKADKVDVLFNDVAISLSQVDSEQVRGQVTLMKPGKVPKKFDCSETASIIYQSEGDIIGDGRMYLRGDCNYIVFYENNQPRYAAHMTEQGLNFYRQVLASGESTINQ